MDYYSCYKFLLNYYDKDTSLIITQYIYAKCNDCNDSYHDEYYECNCGKIRCKHHTYLKTVLVNKDIYCNTCPPKIDWTPTTCHNMYSKYRIFIKCINCNDRAIFGYKDLICYCNKHSNFKKILEYDQVCNHNTCINKTSFTMSFCNEHTTKYELEYCNTGMSIEDKNGKPCSFCKRLFLGLKYCKCSAYCSYCFIIFVFLECHESVCDKCSSNIFTERNSGNGIHILCHNDNCHLLATNIKYGIFLYCDDHAPNTFKYTYFGCCINTCYKMQVYKYKCFDHSSKHVQNKIMKMIKN